MKKAVVKLSKAGIARRDALVVDHLSLVAPIARQIAARLPRSFELDDLIQAGNLGLIDAAKKFKKERGIPFGAYARFRIRGEILSSVRRHEWDNSTTEELTEHHEGIPDLSIAPENFMNLKEVRKIVEDTIGRLLPDKERTVLEIKYLQNSDLNEAARQLKLCPSRASQLHREALRKLSKSARLRNLAA